MSMLVGGGHRAAGSGQTLEVQLLVNGNVVRSLAGDDAGALNWKGWDVSEFAGSAGTAPDRGPGHRRLGTPHRWTTSC